MDANAQPTLFAARTGLSGRPTFVAAHNGTDTSKAAAKVVAPIQGEIAKQILAFAAKCGEHGFTQAEASDSIVRERQYLTHPTQTLERAGLIVKTKEVRYRDGSKAPSAVYQITDAGRERVGGGA
jgi:hypothetical protein